MKVLIKLALIVILCLTVSIVAVLPRGDGNGTEPPDNDSIQTDGDPYNIVDTSKAEYGYSEMLDDLASLAEISRGRLTYSAVGNTLDGRKIYAAVLGNQNAEKQIIISAGIHAREYMTPMLVMKQIEYYLSNYDTGSYGGIPLAEIFEEYAFCILPMCNPDGIALVQNGVEALSSPQLRDTVISIYNTDKKNIPDFADMELNEYLKYWKANARGVDLNRNFNTPAWESNGVRKPCFTDCRGESPLSEPESKAMVDYVMSLSNPVCSVAVHSRGEVVFFDCGQSDKLPAFELASLISAVNGYTVSYDPRSVAAFDDWCIIDRGIPSVTVETGISSCPLPIDEFEKIWNDNRDLWPAIAASNKY